MAAAERSSDIAGYGSPKKTYPNRFVLKDQFGFVFYLNENEE